MQQWILDIISSMGEVGIALLMFTESIILPIPSEYVMPLAGYLSSRGTMNFWGATIAGTVGSLAGALLWYGVGCRISEPLIRRWVARHGLWLGLQESDIDSACRFFQRRGRLGIFLGRLIPVVRVLISVPAGFSRMPMHTFLLYSTIGTFIWNLGLATAGRLMGRYMPRIDDYMGVVTWAVLGLLLIWYVVRVSILLSRRRSGDGIA